MISEYWYSLIQRKNSRFIEKGLLRLSAYLYSSMTHARNFCYDHQWFGVQKATIPVISVGNISVGGSGKTPLAMWCAQFLYENGRKPVIVSRGYGRKSEESKIKIVSNGKEILENVSLGGDEPVLMAKKLSGIPIIVGANRFQTIRTALKSLPVNCAVLDDGFQHRKCGRNLDIVAMDSSLLTAPYLFPRGILRENIHSLNRADFVAIKNGDEQFVGDFEKTFSFQLKKPMGFFTYKISGIRNPINGEIYSNDFLKNKNVFVFCAIANSKSFLQHLKCCGANIAGAQIYKDHHFYSENDLKCIEKKAAELSAQIVTTEKDSVKLPENFPAAVIAIELDWKSGKENLSELLLQRTML